MEARWFLEPFELGVAMGIARVSDNLGTAKTFPAFIAGVTYLLAITPSLAFRVELRGQYLAHSTSSVLVGVGGRLVF